MSRHTIDSTEPNTYYVIGYDRPLKEFYYQEWRTNPDPDDPDEGLVSEGTIDCDWSDCKKAGMLIPDSLIATLVKEAAGEIDPNYCKNWRGAYVRKEHV